METIYDTETGKPVGTTDVVMINGSKVATVIASHVYDLIDAAAKDGVKIIIDSGLRTQSEQIWLRMQNVKDKSRVKLIIDQKGNVVNIVIVDNNWIMNKSSDFFSPATGKPGYSNHQSGLAIDIRSKDVATKLLIQPVMAGGKIVKHSPYSWMVANAKDHGFVRTVPTTFGPKLTVINEGERWHWEYRPGKDMFWKVPKSDPTWDGLIATGPVSATTLNAPIQ